MSNNNKTGNQTHDTAYSKADSIRQAAVMAAPSTPATAVATIATAEITFARTVAASAIANMIGDGVGAYMTLLKSLGRDLYS